MNIGLQRFAVESDWRNETLRTNLWLIPAIETVAAVLLFAVTLSIDHAAFHGDISLPSWVISGSPDAARQILSSLAGSLITVVGVVFSIMIVTLTLASTQFGPRMLRTFIRDRGTQVTLGTFVATFFYAMLTLISIGGTFVPHLSVTVALALTAVDLGVLIYFIHHVATAIQLPEVIASIARDLTNAIGVETGGTASRDELVNGPSLSVLQARLDRGGQVVTAPTSGYLRFVRNATLMRIAAEYDAVIRLHYRPGHFLVAGHPMATVWPPEVADKIRSRLENVHITGPLRTLTQDIAFGIDQLVEIAIRALSPAVNDTFTAMTCIDWLERQPVQDRRGVAPGHLSPRQGRTDTPHYRAGQLRAAGAAVVRENPPGRRRHARRPHQAVGRAFQDHGRCARQPDTGPARSSDDDPACEPTYRY